jgi:hypothetical protein
MFSVDHKKQFYIYQSLFLQKIKKNRRGDSYFFSTLKIWKKIIDDWPPYLNFVSKIEVCIFSFLKLKDLSKLISYLYFDYLDQKFKKKNSRKIGFLTKKYFLGEMSLFMVWERFWKCLIFFSFFRVFVIYKNSLNYLKNMIMSFLWWLLTSNVARMSEIQISAFFSVIFDCIEYFYILIPIVPINLVHRK